MVYPVGVDTEWILPEYSIGIVFPDLFHNSKNVLVTLENNLGGFF